MVICGVGALVNAGTGAVVGSALGDAVMPWEGERDIGNDGLRERREECSIVVVI